MKIVYDIERHRPACPILQAVGGGTHGIEVHFDPTDWLTAPTPDMKCYEVNATQLSQLVTITRKHRARTKTADVVDATVITASHGTPSTALAEAIAALPPEPEAPRPEVEYVL